MRNYFSVTNNQRKWLLAVTLVAFSFLLMNLASHEIESYNRGVEIAELNKRTDAEGTLRHFTISVHYGLAPFGSVVNRFINFVFLPISFLLLLGKGFWKFLFSTTLIGASLTHFCFWIILTVQNLHTWEGDFAQPLHSSQRVIPANSNIFDILLLGCISVLLIWQAKILLRAVLITRQNKKALP